jgi:site-specific recombinase XerC
MKVDVLPALPEPQPVLAVSGYPANKHPVLAYLGRLNTPLSRESMYRRLTVVARLLTDDTMDARHFAWHRLEYSELLAVRARLARTCAMQTVNVTLAAVRGVIREAWRMGYISGEQRDRLCDVQNIPGTRLRVGRALETAELTQLLYSCQADRRWVLGARDAALLGLLYGCGLRSSEAIGLDRQDYDDQAQTIRLIGKGNRQREMPCSAPIAAVLGRWLAMRGPWAGSLLCAVTHGQTILRRRLDRRSVNLILKRRRGVAHVERFTPHDMRRSYISALLDAGVDLATVQQLAGHANPAVTSSYDRRGMRVKVAAAAKLPFPQ